MGYLLLGYGARPRYVTGLDQCENEVVRWSVILRLAIAAVIVALVLWAIIGGADTERHSASAGGRGDRSWPAVSVNGRP